MGEPFLGRSRQSLSQAFLELDEASIAKGADRTRRLLRRLEEVEERSALLRKETERLRKAKDKARQKVLDSFPYLASEVDIEDEEWSTEESSVSSGVTKSEGDDCVAPDSRTLRKNHAALPRGLKEVYQRLEALKRFDDPTSSSSSSTVSKSDDHLRGHSVLKVKALGRPPHEPEQPLPNNLIRGGNYKDLAEYDPLGRLLAGYLDPKPSETRQPRYKVKSSTSKEATADIPQNGCSPLSGNRPFIKRVDTGEAMNKSSDEEEEKEAGPGGGHRNVTGDPTLRHVVSGPGFEKVPDTCEVLLEAKAKDPSGSSRGDGTVSEDTSHDGTDLESNSAKLQKAPGTGGQANVDDEDDDQNFVLDSDNAEEKLYSSETENNSHLKGQEPQAVSGGPNVLRAPPPLSSSSSSESVSNTKNKAPPAMAFKLRSDSEVEYEVSGPDNVLEEDDFWN